MKKLLILLAIIGLLASCTNYDKPVSNSIVMEINETKWAYDNVYSFFNMNDSTYYSVTIPKYMKGKIYNIGDTIQ